MKYYSQDCNVDDFIGMTAGKKAREDLERIVQRLGYQALPIHYGDSAKGPGKNPLSKMIDQVRIYMCIRRAYRPLKRGDSLFIQFPLKRATIFYYFLLKGLRRRSVQTILLVHDLDTLRRGRQASTRFIEKAKLKLVEIPALRCASKVIVHNSFMAYHLTDLGVSPEKMVPLEIFDYLLPSPPARNDGESASVIIAGYLSEHYAGYVYHLPEDVQINLYGVNFTGQAKGSIRYLGAFPSEELPYIMEGRFGLVWAGGSAETCDGAFGEYLRLNSPHKASLYLAAGIPVAIWSQAALAEFVLKNNVGITVDSLADLREAVSRVTEEEYAEMAKNARRIGEKLRRGGFSAEAIRRCE